MGKIAAMVKSTRTHYVYDKLIVNLDINEVPHDTHVVNNKKTLIAALKKQLTEKLIVWHLLMNFDQCSTCLKLTT